MSKVKLKLFPARQVAVDLLGSGFSVDGKTLTDLEALHKIPTVQRAAVQWKNLVGSNPIDDLVYGAILAGKLPAVGSKGMPLHTPLNPSQLKDVFVNPTDVNALLFNAGFRVIWSPIAKRTPRTTPASQISWKLRVQEEATELCLRFYASGANPSVTDLANSMAKWCVKNKVVAERGVPPSASYIRVHVLGSDHWKKPVKP
jgi:hypothetical protein